MIKVLVTGANGFVGQHVVRALADSPSEFEIVTAGTGENAGIALDISDAVTVEKVIESVAPDVVIHLAAIAFPRAAVEAPNLAWDVNFGGALAIARSIRRHVPSARLIFAGSSEAYGKAFTRTHGAISEDAPLMPQTVYAATKACADIALGQMAADGLDCVRFRPFNHTGPGQAPLYVVADFANQIAEIEYGLRKPVIRVGNLETARDFLDVRDVARAYTLAAAARPGPLEETAFNLSSGTAVRIGDMLDMLLACSTVPIAVEPDPARQRANEIPCAYGDASRARDVFGWEAKIELLTSIADVLDDQRRRVSGRAG